MNTIGQILKEARVKKNISLIKLENLTKIKREFILKLEKDDWDNLPEFPVVSGFVKNLANALGISSNNANAILRRDYPPKKLTINPKPDVGGKFSWSPKLTFAVGIGILLVFVLGYLGIEYVKFIKPPELIIDKPVENEQILQNKVKIEGKTTTDAILTVNNQPIIFDQDGKFITEIEITKDTKELKFISISRSGKKTEIIRKITVE
ncbi:MAG TPA: helix-turn-helix domain-containing protein [Patescibacteria group bacterium]|nr:helix-turn-helix domain-containing protein [Patescibacteria group bacterium]